ncbi:MAG: hypothetical protein DRQ46_00015 [Gammaproteobacteria bacterium]|nr:MAG: hypothetical protein DRQ46_00015 [Gammaproteobacteria bacterium]
MDIPTDIDLTVFSDELKQELEYRIDCFDVNDIESEGDEFLYEVITDLEGFLVEQNIMSKWKTELRKWMIARNVYIEISDEELKDMVMLPRSVKKYDFTLNKTKYIFNKHYQNPEEKEGSKMSEENEKQIEAKDEFDSVVWNIYITDQEVSESVTALCEKLSLSRNIVVGRILKRYAPALLNNDKELMSIIINEK